MIELVQNLTQKELASFIMDGEKTNEALIKIVQNMSPEEHKAAQKKRHNWFTVMATGVTVCARGLNKIKDPNTPDYVKPLIMESIANISKNLIIASYVMGRRDAIELPTSGGTDEIHE